MKKNQVVMSEKAFEKMEEQKYHEYHFQFGVGLACGIIITVLMTSIFIFA